MLIVRTPDTLGDESPAVSIDMERFEDGDPDAWDGPTNAERVLAFLVEHDNRAWKVGEIADRIGTARGSIGPVLVRLLELDPSANEDRTGRSPTIKTGSTTRWTSTAFTAGFDERFGVEDRSEWLGHAADTGYDGDAAVSHRPGRRVRHPRRVANPREPGHGLGRSTLASRNEASRRNPSPTGSASTSPTYTRHSRATTTIRRDAG